MYGRVGNRWAGQHPEAPMSPFNWTAVAQLHRPRRNFHMDSACGICTAVNGEPGGGPTILPSFGRLRSAVVVWGQKAASHSPIRCRAWRISSPRHLFSPQPRPARHCGYPFCHVPNRHWPRTRTLKKIWPYSNVARRHPAYSASRSRDAPFEARIMSSLIRAGPGRVSGHEVEPGYICVPHCDLILSKGSA